MITLEMSNTTAGSVAHYYNPASGELISGMVNGKVRCFFAETRLKIVRIIDY
jgi:hypothetical protein